MAVKLNIWDTQLVLDALEAYPKESKELETLIRRFNWSLKALVGVYERELRIEQFRSGHWPSVRDKQQKPWPKGLFHLTGDTLHLRCATAGCGQHVSTRFEAEGVGSDYCEPCGRMVAQAKDK